MTRVPRPLHRGKRRPPWQFRRASWHVGTPSRSTPSLHPAVSPRQRHGEGVRGNVMGPVEEEIAHYHFPRAVGLLINLGAFLRSRSRAVHTGIRLRNQPGGVLTASAPASMGATAFSPPAMNCPTARPVSGGPLSPPGHGRTCRRGGHGRVFLRGQVHESAGALPEAARAMSGWRTRDHIECEDGLGA
jgi:hypothetical protein